MVPMTQPRLTAAGLAVGAEVRAEMGRQRRTRTEVAKQLGMDIRAVQRRWDDEVEWGVTELARLSAFLGVPVAQFVDLAVAAVTATEWEVSA